MNIYLTTDTHFGHDKLIEYCDRPKGFEDLIMKGFKILQPDDLLIHLGDICIGKDAEKHEKYIYPIPCKKILCKGNHDGKSNGWYLSHGWDFVCDKFQDNYFGKRIMFSHVPAVDDGEFDINIHGHFHNNLHRLLEGRYVVEGEKERNERDLRVLTPKHKLLAIENTDYKLVNLKDFLEY